MARCELCFAKLPCWYPQPASDISARLFDAVLFVSSPPLWQPPFLPWRQLLACIDNPCWLRRRVMRGGRTGGGTDLWRKEGVGSCRHAGCCLLDGCGRPDLCGTRWSGVFDGVPPRPRSAALYHLSFSGTHAHFVAHQGGFTAHLDLDTGALK
eukprot:2231677-Rhodomonas_salina.1